jgi:uncharacterized protein
MRIKKERVPEDGLDVHWNVTASDIGITGDDVFRDCRDVEFSGHVQRQNDDMIVRGTVSGLLLTSCARCLEEAAVPVVAPIDMLFIAGEEGGARRSEDTVEEIEETDSVEMYDGVELDLRDLIRDQMLVSLPLKPLCREDCRGLCPNCGANLNTSPCSCEKRSVDPRLAKLAGWKSAPAGTAQDHPLVE